MKTDQAPTKRGGIRIDLPDGAKEVVLSQPCLNLCFTCGEWAPLELRRTSDGVVRNQPNCPSCRKRNPNLLEK